MAEIVEAKLNLPLSRKITAFQNSEVFKILSPNAIEDIASRTIAVRFKKGSFIFIDGEKAAFFYIIDSGLIKLYKGSSTGKNVMFSIAKDGDTLNASALSVDRYFMTAQAITDVIALRLERKDLFHFLNKYPNIAVQIMKKMAGRLDEECQKIVHITGEEAEQRIINSLYRLSSKLGPILTIRRKELAEFSGITTETTIRALSKLKKKGIIGSSSKRGEIIISDMEELQSLTV
jgi:CRP/FNR family transcriptional regulator